MGERLPKGDRQGVCSGSSSRKLIVPEVVGFLVVKEWQGIKGSWSGENKGECVEDKI